MTDTNRSKSVRIRRETRSEAAEENFGYVLLILKSLTNTVQIYTMFENQRKSLILYCEQSELCLHTGSPNMFGMGCSEPQKLANESSNVSEKMYFAPRNCLFSLFCELLEMLMDF